MRRPRSSTLFPSTTLFRSHIHRCLRFAIMLAPWRLPPLPVAPRTLPSIAGVPSTASYPPIPRRARAQTRSEEHTSELQSQSNLVCRLLLEKKITDMDDVET